MRPDRHNAGVSAVSLWTLGAGLAAVALLTLVSLTAIGARRRGQRWFSACLSGLIFPLTWTVWYLLDEPPAVRKRRRAMDE
jgi:hypothetical protein